jgi:hypothetical protein
VCENEGVEELSPQEELNHERTSQADSSGKEMVIFQ